jgi:hypothetical protein
MSKIIEHSLTKEPTKPPLILPKLAKKIVKQRHHILYKEKDGKDWIVTIKRSEHFWITRLSWFKSLSKGAKTAIKHILKTKPTDIL